MAVSPAVVRRLRFAPAVDPRVPGYERLSAPDALFVGLEEARSPMHVMAVLVFDAPDQPPVQAVVQTLMHALPHARQRVRRTPLGPCIWVDEPRFDVGHHVHSVRLPAPADVKTLQLLASRIASEPLDLDRPPWGLWVIEPVSPRGFAVVAKLHHSLLDGVAGVQA